MSSYADFPPFSLDSCYNHCKTPAKPSRWVFGRIGEISTDTVAAYLEMHLKPSKRSRLLFSPPLESVPSANKKT